MRTVIILVDNHTKTDLIPSEVLRRVGEVLEKTKDKTKTKTKRKVKYQYAFLCQHIITSDNKYQWPVYEFEQEKE